MVLAVAHPWASASSYLSSQSVADSRISLQPSCHPAVFLLSSFSLKERKKTDNVLPKRKKERKQTTQGRDGRTVHRHHTGISRISLQDAS